MFLIDTMAVSEYSKERPDANVVRWFQSIRFEDACLSVVTIGEIERGIRKYETREGHSN